LTIKYLRRESFSFLPDSLVKDRDHRGSKGGSRESHLLIRAADSLINLVALLRQGFAGHPA